jgi:hypothetical protein
MKKIKDLEIKFYWGILLGIGYKEETLLISFPFFMLSFDIH